MVDQSCGEDTSEARRRHTGLTTRDVSDLRFYFREFESMVGQKSTFSLMLAHWAGASFDSYGGVSESFDPYAGCVPGITRAKKVWRVLKRMQELGYDHHVTVLYGVYGEHRPNAPYAEFKGTRDMAPLAAFTEAAESARLEMVAAVASKAKEAKRTVTRAHRKKAENEWRAGIERAAIIEEELDALDRGGSLGVLAMPGKGVGKLAKVEAEYRASLRAELDAWMVKASAAGVKDPDSKLDEVMAVRADSDANKTVSVEEAIRWKLTYTGPVGDDGKPSPEPFAVWQSDRSSFVASMMSESAAMLASAGGVYRATREAA